MKKEKYPIGQLSIICIAIIIFIIFNIFTIHKLYYREWETIGSFIVPFTLLLWVLIIIIFTTELSKEYLKKYKIFKKPILVLEKIKEWILYVRMP